MEGGHGAAANHDEEAFMNALAYTFLWKELMPKGQEGERPSEKGQGLATTGNMAILHPCGSVEP